MPVLQQDICYGLYLGVSPRPHVIIRGTLEKLLDYEDIITDLLLRDRFWFEDIDHWRYDLEGFFWLVSSLSASQNPRGD